MRLAFLALAVCSAALPGCIAWEIRDAVRTTNQHLCEVTPALAMTLHTVDETNREIVKTQAQLLDVQGQIAQVQAQIVATQTQLDALHASLIKTDGTVAGVSGTLGQTNPMLTGLSEELERLHMLNDMHTTLTQVQSSLGPLGKSLGSVGGALSFLGVSGDASTDMLSQEERAAAAGGEGQEPAAVGEPGAKRPDPILGTWVLVYPPPHTAESPSEGRSARVTVFAPDGKLLMVEEGHKPRIGTWNRKGRTLSLTLDPEVPGQPPESDTAELLTLNSRTMTLRRGDFIRVHARP